MRIWYSFIHLTKWRERRVTYKQPIGYINQCSLYDKCYFYHLSMKKRVAIFFSPAILRLKYLQSKMKKSPVKYDDAIAFILISLFLVQQNVFLPYKKRMLICKIGLLKHSWVPNEIKRTTIFLMFRSLTASHMKREFCVTLRYFHIRIHFSVLND